MDNEFRVYPNGYIALDDVPKYAPLNKGTLNKWRCQGKGPKHAKIAGKIYYRKSDIDDYIEKLSGFTSTEQTRYT